MTANPNSDVNETRRFYEEICKMFKLGPDPHIYNSTNEFVDASEEKPREWKDQTPWFSRLWKQILQVDRNQK